MKKYLIASLLALGFVAPMVLPVLADNATPTPTPTPSVSPTPTPTPSYDVVCVQNSISKREDSLITATDAYTSAVKTAAIARRDALKAAVVLTDAKARRQAIRAAEQAYRAAIKTASTNAKSSEKTTLKQFTGEIKACGLKSYGKFGYNLGDLMGMGRFKD